jgi:hypothetical protein
LLSEPVLKAARRRRARARRLGDENFAIFEGDLVLAPLGDGAGNTHGGVAAAKADGAVAVFPTFERWLESIGTSELPKKPVLVPSEERRDVVNWPGSRADDLDAMRSDTDTEFLRSP